MKVTITVTVTVTIMVTITITVKLTIAVLLLLLSRQPRFKSDGFRSRKRTKGPFRSLQTMSRHAYRVQV